VVDDIIIYKFSDELFLFCVNASNSAKDYEWIKKEKGNFDVEVLDRSLEYSQIAIQGPDSQAILSDSIGADLDNIKKFRFEVINWEGRDLIVARTGYTGEDGFEIFLPWDGAPSLWNRLMEVGNEHGVKPCGLGARDTLRIEMGYSLYGHEIDEDINPLQAGLDRYVKMDADNFIGKEVLSKALDEGLSQKLVGFEMIDRGIPRQGYSIFKNGVFLGNVTSGTLSPSLEKSIGLGYLSSNVEGDDRIQIQIRDTVREAEIVSIPFYNKEIN
jgi:aminomethyltransferase